jgi:hypothetical protein
VRAASPSPAGKDESSGTSTPRKRASTPTAPRSTVNAKAKKATPSKAAPSKAALKAPKRPRERDSSPSPPAKEEPNPLPELEPLETPKKKRAAQTLSPELTPKRERRASPSWPVRKREPKREREHQHPFVDIPTLAHRSEWHTSIFGNAYPHPHPHPYPHQHDHSLPYTHSLLSVPVAKAGFRGTFETVLADSARNPFVGPAQRFSPPPPVGI